MKKSRDRKAKKSRHPCEGRDDKQGTERPMAYPCNTLTMKKFFTSLLFLFLFLSIGLGSIHALEAPEKYTINLFWINNTLDPQQKTIFPARDDRDLHTKYINQIFEWATKNVDSGATVMVWYDSVLTTPQALECTKTLLDKAPEHPHAPIVLRDIRDLPLVKENPDLYTDKVPVYFRADLTRALAGIHELEMGNTLCYIFSNFNMPPLTKDELFDEKTLQKLGAFGFIMAYNTTGVNSSCFEHSFFIFTRTNPDLFSLLKTIVVKNTMHRARDLMKQEFSNTPASKKLFNKVNFLVYHSYLTMMNQYAFDYHRTEGTLLPQDHARAAYLHTHYPHGSNIKTDLDYEDWRDNLTQIETLTPYKKRCQIFMHILPPTKRVILPSAKMKYNSHQKGNNPEAYEYRRLRGQS